MEIDYDRLHTLVGERSPGPWQAVGQYDDGSSRPDTSRLMRSGDGEYLGIMHGPDAELAALAPELARELLWIRKELRETLSNVEDQLTRIEPELKAARITVYAEREHFRDLCQHLLKGEQK